MLQLAVDARVLFNTWMRHIDPSHCSDLRQRSSNHACKDWVTPSKKDKLIGRYEGFDP